MERKKILKGAILPILFIGGISATSYLLKQRKKELPRQETQISYIYNPSNLNEGSRVKVNYTGEYDRTLLQQGEKTLAKFVTKLPHSDDYYVARNDAIPENSEGILVGTTPSGAYFVNFPQIRETAIPKKYSDSWFVKDDEGNLVSISQYQEGKTGLVARFDKEELLVEK